MNILDKIVSEKRIEVSDLPRCRISGGELRAALEARGGQRDFAAALRQPKLGSIGLIAEVKKGSPSAGWSRF